MKKLLVLTLTAISFGGFAQENLHDATIIGSVSIGNNEITSVIDNVTGCSHKSSLHTSGLFITGENVTLEIRENGLSPKVIKPNLPEVVIVDFCADNTPMAKPRFRMKHKEYSAPGIRSGCDFPRGMCLTITFLTELDPNTGELIDPLLDDEGTADMKVLGIEENINEDETVFYTGKLSFVFDQSTALEDGTIPVLGEEMLGSDMANLIRFNEVIVEGGNYQVDFSQHQFGEVIYNFVAKGKLVIED